MKTSILLCIVSILIAEKSISQPGKLDSSFGQFGSVKVDFGKANLFDEIASQLFLHKNGSYVLFIQGANVLARFLPNGNIDKSYGKDGHVLTNLDGNAVVQQSDGKILVGGTNGGLARYNVNGSLDSTFGQNGQIGPNNSGVRSLLIQNDGKIVINGGGSIFRYSSDGYLDDTFKLDTTLFAVPRKGSGACFRGL